MALRSNGELLIEGPTFTVAVHFEPPDGFERASEERLLWVRGSGPTLSQREFLRFDIRGSGQAQSVGEAIARLRRAHVDEQAEFPFRSGPTVVAELPQRITVLEEEVTSRVGVLSFGTDYPEGAPAGQIFPSVRAYCVRPIGETGFFIHLYGRSPLERQRLFLPFHRSLCNALGEPRILE